MQATLDQIPIAEGLSRVRKQRQVSTAALAALVAPQNPAITASRLSRLSLGYAHATETEIRVIASALGVSIEEIIGQREHPDTKRGEMVPVDERPTETWPTAPTSVPARDHRTVDAYRSALGLEIQQARTALNTPKLPARNWAAWRAYEGLLRRALAELPLE